MTLITKSTSELHRIFADQPNPKSTSIYSKAGFKIMEFPMSSRQANQLDVIRQANPIIEWHVTRPSTGSLILSARMPGHTTDSPKRLSGVIQQDGKYFLSVRVYPESPRDIVLDDLKSYSSYSSYSS